MIDVKLIKKPKDSSTRGSGSAGMGGTAEETKRAARADKSGYADLAEYANRAGYASRSAYADQANDIPEDSPLYDRLLRKDTPDTAREVIRFLQGLALGEENGRYYLDGDGFAKLYRLILSSITSSRYVSGDEGNGYALYEDENGIGTLEVDILKVRKKMTAQELEVRKKTYTTGNLSIGKAGNTIFAVRPYGADGSPISDKVFSVGGMVIAVRKNSVQVLGRKTEGGSPAFYRCYFLRTDGDRTIDNCWRIGDQAKCQTHNLADGKTSKAANRYYWRLVVGKGTEILEDGREYHYVDLSNEETPTIEILPVIKGEALRLIKATEDEGQTFSWEEYIESHPIGAHKGDVYLFARTDGAGSEPEVITYTSSTEYTLTVPMQDDVYRTADGKLYSADLDDNGELWIERPAEVQTCTGYDTSVDNDAPMTGDDIAQEGSQTDKSRQGLVVIDAEEGISKYKNIDSFSYKGKRKQHIGDTVELEVNRLTIVSEAPDGTEEKHRVPCYMGAWTERAYPYYAQVDCDGSLWLCFNPAGAKKTDRPKDDSRAWRKQVSKGEGIDVKGSVPNASSLPTGAQEGDCYITDDDGHMRRWNGTEWKDLGQIKGMDGKNGRDAEVYRLMPLTERAVVGADKRLVASLAYRIEHVVGNTITEVPATQDLRVRYQGDRNVPAPTYMSSGDKPSVSYTLEEYPAVAHPDALHVELVNAKDEVLDRRVIPVTFSTLAALDINGRLGTISAKVQGMTVGGRNLLRGTAFRKEVPGWFKLRSEAVIDKDRKHNDHNSVDCSATGQTENTYKGVFFTAAVEQKKVYTVSVWVHGDPDTIDKDAYIEVFYTDSHGQRQPVALRSIKPTAAGAWQRFSETFIVPSGVSEIACNFFIVRNGQLHIAEPMLASGNMLTDWQPAPEDAEAYIAEVNLSVGHIDSSVKDMKTGLEVAGVHIDGESKSIELNGDTTVRDANGNTTAMFKDGKVSADVIDAKEIVTKGIKSQTIDAKNATFKDLNVQNGKFSGSLDGVVGSFRRLICIDMEGNVVGEITFTPSGSIWITGDLYHQGTKGGRNMRFYAGDLWCRGAFGHAERTCAVIKNDIMYVHIKGAGENGIGVRLPTARLTSGETVYKIPLYSPGYQGVAGDFGTLINPNDPVPSGLPIDMVVFNCTANHHYSFMAPGNGKTWTVINGNDTQSVFIIDIGGWAEVPGGTSANYFYVNPKWLTPYHSDPNRLGNGVFYAGRHDLDW